METTSGFECRVECCANCLHWRGKFDFDNNGTCGRDNTITNAGERCHIKLY